MEGDIGTDTPPPSCAQCGPPIELNRGGTLSLRHAGGGDVEGLLELYRQLPPSDLRRRFFTAGPPSPKFLEYWASLESHGGFGLVAELAEDGGTHVVGEAGYGCWEDHSKDGELGITVAPRSRGWLGPWLLDRLLAHAAERGVPNIQAVIMTDNRPMLAMAAKRGYAILGHPEGGLIRITMATTGSVPSWPGDHDRPRILVEADRTRWIGEAALAEAGFDVALCATSCRGDRSCPVQSGHPCPLIDGADVVIVDLRDGVEAEQLVGQERVVHPGIRQIVVDHPDQGAEGRRMTNDELLASIRRLLAPPAEEDRS